MMTMMILAPRRAGMTHQEFRTYVTQVHGPLVRSVTEVAADIRHYHYNFPVIGQTDRAFGHPLADLDIVTQGFFDSREAQLLNMQHPRFKQILRPDESNFADTARALMHYTDARVVVQGAKTEWKVFYMRRRAAHLSREEFQARWHREFPLALESTPLRAAITRYVQNHVQAEAHHPNGTHPKFYDLIDEFWLSDAGAWDALSPDGGERVRRLETDLLDTSRTRSFVATMVPNIP